MSNPPLYPNDPDCDDGSGNSFGLNPARRQFRGLIDFGAFGGGAPGFESQWQATHDMWIRAGLSEAEATANANQMFGVGTVDVYAQQSAAKAAADAKQIQIATQIAKDGTKTAVDTGTTLATTRTYPGSPGVLVTGQSGQTAGGNAGQPASSSNTMMYVGAAAVALGLAYVASKRGRGSLGGYSRRHRKSRRKSRKSRR